MRSIRRWVARLSGSLRKQHQDRELAEEMENHLELHIADNVRAGMTREVARRDALRKLGGVEATKDQQRDRRGIPWLDTVAQDLRYSARTLRRNPGFAATAILTLALGIGANAAIFSLVNGLLLRPLPVKEPSRLVLVASDARFPGLAEWSFPVWDHIRKRPDLFDGTVAWSYERFNLSPGGETQFVEGLWASGSFFDTLGVPAWRGRTFSEADDQRGGGREGPVAVISYDFWQRRFGGTADTIGRTLILDRVPFTIVGVTPPDFSGPNVGRALDVIVPVGDEPLLRGRETLLDSRWPWLTIMARLKPEQTADRATAEVRELRIWEEMASEDASKEERNQYLKHAVTLVPAATGNSFLAREYKRPVLTMMVVVAIVLLIACANLANLLIARATARRHELSVRRALGASRWRLMRQLLTESFLLAGAGATFGLAIALWTSGLIVRLLSTQTDPVFLDLSIDWRVVVFAVGVTAATALMFGVAPTLHTSGGAPIDGLKEHGSRPSVGRHGHVGLASGLVVAQVALSVVLVVAAGLFLRTFSSLATRDLGFVRDRVLSVVINAPSSVVDSVQRVSLYERARQAVRILPGVDSAVVSLATPIVRGPILSTFVDEVSGSRPLPQNDRLTSTNVISPGWFSTFGIPVITGRDFTDRDRTGTPLVVVVNQAFARKVLNDASPLDHTITVNLGVPATPRLLEIVGVAADTVYSSSLRTPMPPTIYLPIAQAQSVPLPFLASVNLSVRSSGGSPAFLTKSVAAAIGEINPGVALTFRPVADQIHASLSQERVIAMISGFFGALALLLAGLGIYGVTSYAVIRRRTEIGIRLALGAARASVLRLVLSRVVTLVALGIAAGSGVSLWLSPLVAALLYGVEPRDPVTIVTTAVILVTVGLCAGWVPARRAVRIDPAQVLRDA